MELNFISSANYENQEYLLDNFLPIYNQAFPDKDERENFDDIKDRIKLGDKAYPETYAVVATSDEGKVIGANIFDWYPETSDAELIYIAVASNQRCKGIGSWLLNEGCKLFQSKKKEMTALYLETENPMLNTNIASPIDPIDRLHFFARNGIKRVNIDYIQPPLGTREGDEPKNCADNLLLCIYPEFSDCLINDSFISAQSLNDFITAFYRGLNSLSSEEYQKVMHSIQVETSTENLVDVQNLIEKPSFSVSNVSVVWHYEMKLNDNKSLFSEPCPIFNSYECDLMNYRHQAFIERPIVSRHFRLFENVVIRMPACYSYTSEGHDFFRLTKERKIPVDISINASRGRDGKCIASVVINSDSNYNINELDLIKLITPFGSIQENYTPNEEILFYVDDNATGITMIDMLQRVFGSGEFNPLRTGITDLVLDDADCFNALCSANVVGIKRHEDIVNALCGIVLGIFDFNRMNIGEVMDTIQPFAASDESFLTICRGHLLKFRKCQDNDERTENILISPYLLIPSAILCLNELTLRNCNARIENLPRKSRFNNPFRNSLAHKISEIMLSTMEELQEDYYEDVFNYPSEQEIMRIASNSRGYLFYRKEILEKIDAAGKRVDAIRSKHQTMISSIESIILMELAVGQVVTALDGKTTVWMLLIIIGVIAVLINLFRFKD